MNIAAALAFVQKKALPHVERILALLVLAIWIAKGAGYFQNLSDQQVITLTFFAIAIIVLDISSQIVRLEEAIRVHKDSIDLVVSASSGQKRIALQSLSSAMQLLAERTPTVIDLRVFAITSGQIEPCIETSRLSIGRCTVLLYDPDADKNGFFDDPEAEKTRAGFAAQCSSMIQNWTRMKSNGRINEIAAGRYHFWPTEYYVIADESLLMIGTYRIQSSSFPRVDTGEVMVVVGDSAAAKEIINHRIRTFDALSKVCKLSAV